VRGCCEHSNKPSGSIEGGEFLDQLNDSFSKGLFSMQLLSILCCSTDSLENEAWGFQWRWKLKSRSSGLWHRVVLQALHAAHYAKKRGTHAWNTNFIKTWNFYLKQFLMWYVTKQNVNTAMLL